MRGLIKLSKTENSPLEFTENMPVSPRFRKLDILHFNCNYFLFSRHFIIKLPQAKYVFEKVCAYVCICGCAHTLVH